MTGTPTATDTPTATYTPIMTATRDATGAVPSGSPNISDTPTGSMTPRPTVTETPTESQSRTPTEIPTASCTRDPDDPRVCPGRAKIMQWRAQLSDSQSMMLGLFSYVSDPVCCHIAGECCKLGKLPRDRLWLKGLSLINRSNLQEEIEYILPDPIHNDIPPYKEFHDTSTIGSWIIVIIITLIFIFSFRLIIYYAYQEGKRIGNMKKGLKNVFNSIGDYSNF
jgi:hypothetical protein